MKAVLPLDNSVHKRLETKMERILAQLLCSARYNVAQIDADLSGMRAPFTPDKMYHQGYQTGRKAELESLIATLEWWKGLIHKRELDDDLIDYARSQWDGRKPRTEYDQ